MNRLYWKLYRIWQIITNSLYWLFRDIKFSEFSRGENYLLNQLLISGHVMEKGITMPNRKNVFGLGNARGLIALCHEYIKKYGNDADQLQFALDDLWEYRKIYHDSHVDLPKDIEDGISGLLKFQKMTSSESVEATTESYFSPCKDFLSFAHQRHSIRSFMEKNIPSDMNTKVVQLAQTAPSACNRQSVKVHVYEGEKKDQILEVPNGSRGFGIMANKIMIVTSEQTAWDGYFTKAAYLDAGIFTMNLLYALHYYKIAACTLNMYLLRKDMNRIRQLTGIADSEIPCVMIAIGYPSESFSIAKSHRIDVNNVLLFH